MTERDTDRELDELVEQFLVFLRGQGPEPDLGHLSPTRRRDVRARLEIVDTLFGSDTALPPVEDDPVAIQLGLVPGPNSDGVSPAPPGAGIDSDDVHIDPRADEHGRHDAWPGMDAAHRALEDLKAEFSGQVAIDWRPEWAAQGPSGRWDGGDLPLLPLGQCSVLGDTVALFISSGGAGSWIDSIGGPATAASANTASSASAISPREAHGLALFLRIHPDISSVGLVSHDGAHAAIVPAAACNRSIDPLRGWLEPGAFVDRDDLSLLMSRYFEQRLPRWERVSGLAEVLTMGDDLAATQALVEQQRDELLKARPRLEHKKHAQARLREIDPYAVTSLINGVQTNLIDELDFVERVESLVGDTS